MPLVFEEEDLFWEEGDTPPPPMQKKEHELGLMAHWSKSTTMDNKLKEMVKLGVIPAKELIGWRRDSKYW